MVGKERKGFRDDERELRGIKKMKKIETERLILRKLFQDDANAVFEWTGDPIVNRYMPYPLHESVHQTEEWIRSLEMY